MAGFFHGILTGSTEPTWPEEWEDELLARDPESRAVLTWYKEFPLPRFAAIRNRKRVPRLVRRIEKKFSRAWMRTDRKPEIFLFGHSNGGVLVMQVAEELIRRGYDLAGICLIAPAVRQGKTTRLFNKWIEEGRLGRALLIQATRDRVLGFAHSAKVLTWPWGALGVEGWAEEEISPDHRDAFGEVRLNVRHSDLLTPEERARTFERYAAPFMDFPKEETK